jgi:hypothetical protein
MDAWSKKTFSAQEKIMAKAKMESFGVDEKEFDNLQDIFVLIVLIFSISSADHSTLGKARVFILNGSEVTQSTISLVYTVYFGSDIRSLVDANPLN